MLASLELKKKNGVLCDLGSLLSVKIDPKKHLVAKHKRSLYAVYITVWTSEWVMSKNGN